MHNNTGMNLKYNHKEIYNQPIILHTPTTVNLNNKNQSKIIMSKENKNQRTIHLYRRVKNEHSKTSPIINKTILTTTRIMKPTTEI